MCVYIYIYICACIYIYINIIYIYVYIYIHSLLIALAALRLRKKAVLFQLTYVLVMVPVASSCHLFLWPPGSLPAARGPVPGCLLRSRCSGDVCDRVHASRRLPVKPNELVVMDVHHKYSILELIRTYYEPYI